MSCACDIYETKGFCNLAIIAKITLIQRRQIFDNDFKCGNVYDITKSRSKKNKDRQLQKARDIKAESQFDN